MKSLALIALLSSVASSVAPPVARADRYSFDPAAIYAVPAGDSPTEGPADAPITIVAWSDFACAHCYRVQATLDQLQRLYPGQLRFVHRTLPLDEDDLVAAEAGYAAAAQHRFAPMKDRLYAIAGRVDRPAVELIARELGLDMMRFRADLDTHAFAAQIRKDTEDAVRLGIEGTPAFFVNGRPVHGDQPLSVFARTVDEELLRAGGKTYAQLVDKGRARADAPHDSLNEIKELDAHQPYRIGLGLPGHQLGADDAPVTIVEWADFQCPYCAKTQPELAAARAKYGDRLRIVFRHFPVYGHRLAPLAAEAAIAAGAQGKFWPFQDQLWAHFGNLSRADLEHAAETAGLDLNQFRAALDSRKYRDAVVAEAANAAALGVEATPTIFINGLPLVGSREPADFAKVVDTHFRIAAQVMHEGLPQNQIYAVIMAAALDSERADPSRVPTDPSIVLAPRADENSRSVAAACRIHDRARATALASHLTGDARHRALQVCTGEGIDL